MIHYYVIFATTTTSNNEVISTPRTSSRSGFTLKEANHSLTAATLARHHDHHHHQQQPQSLPSASLSTTTSKPQFIIHIGPPKTATTTIQCVFEANSRALALDDHLYYLGTCCNKKRRLPNGELSLLGGLATDLDNYYRKKNDETKVTSNSNNQNLQLLLERMKHHYKFFNSTTAPRSTSGSSKERATHSTTMISHHNLLLSMEGLSRRLLPSKPRRKTDKDDDLDDSQNGIAALASLVSKDWSPRIILTYRHYFDWLPSLYYQEQKETFKYYDKRIQKIVAEQGNNTSIEIDNDDGSPQQHYQQHRLSSYEMFLKAELPKKQHMSLKAFKMYSKYFEDIEIFFFHYHNSQQQNQHQDQQQQQQTLGSNFVCQTMNDVAPNLCSTLMLEQQQQQEHDLIPSNIQSLPLPYKKNVSTNRDQYRLLEVGLQTNTIKGKGRPTTSILHELENAIEKYHDQLPINEVSKSLFAWQHPDNPFMTCLNDVLREQLLQQSITYEQELLDLLMAHRKQNNIPNKDEAKAQHKQMFQEYQQNGKFCELDTMKVIQNEEWKQILSKV